MTWIVLARSGKISWVGQPIAWVRRSLHYITSLHYNICTFITSLVYILILAHFQEVTKEVTKVATKEVTKEVTRLGTRTLAL